MRSILVFVTAILQATPVLSADPAPTFAPKVLSPQARPGTFSMNDSGCGGEGTLADAECSSRYLEWLDVELNRAYSEALAKMPKAHPTDSRKNREQLRKSQRAWLKFKSDNCTLEGALEGGSNLWVTRFAQMCEERETKSRILFLSGIER